MASALFFLSIQYERNGEHKCYSTQPSMMTGAKLQVTIIRLSSHSHTVLCVAAEPIELHVLNTVIMLIVYSTHFEELL